MRLKLLINRKILRLNLRMWDYQKKIFLHANEFFGSYSLVWIIFILFEWKNNKIAKKSICNFCLLADFNSWIKMINIQSSKNYQSKISFHNLAIIRINQFLINLLIKLIKYATIIISWKCVIKTVLSHILLRNKM